MDAQADLVATHLKTNELVSFLCLYTNQIFLLHIYIYEFVTCQILILIGLYLFFWLYTCVP